MRRSTRAVLLAIPLLVAACNPVGRVIDAHRGAATQRLAALEALGRIARAAPPQRSNTVDLGGREALRFPVLGGPGDWTAAVVHVEALDDLTREPELSLDVGTDPFWWWGSACLIRNDGEWTNGEPLAHEQTARDTFADLARVEYVLIVRTEEHVAPRIDVAASEASGGTFRAGRFVADAQLFSLTDQVALGGFPIVATSSARVQTETTGPQDYDLDTDLKIQVDDVIREALEAFSVPGATLGGT